MPPVKPMLAKAVPEIPAAAEGELLFEPKWDGFRCIVFRDGDEVELGSRNERPLTRYFPELIEPLLRRAAGPLRRRRRGGRGQRGRARLRRAPAADPPGGVTGRTASPPRPRPASSPSTCSPSTTGRPPRRAVPRAAGRRSSGCSARSRRRSTSRRRPTDRAVAQDWFVRFEGAGLDGVIAKPADGAYAAGQAGACSRSSTSAPRTAWSPASACTRTARASARCSSASTTTTAGCTTSGWPPRSRAARRKELVAEVEPYRADDLADHPWGEWATARRRPTADGRMPGGQSAGGTPSKDLSFTPLRPERVAEVGLRAGRLRALPAQRPPAPLAARPRPGQLHLRPARGGPTPGAAGGLRPLSRLRRGRPGGSCPRGSRWRS